MIISNFQERQFIYGYDVPAKVLESDFDWLSDDEKADGFIKYKGRYYHVSEFVTYTSHPYWQGYTPDSAFSATMLKVSEDGETYVIGTLLH